MQLLDEDEFELLTIEQQRVAIAKDVIARIDLDLIAPSAGCLFEEHTIDAIERKTKNFCHLKDIFNETKCEVCAKGALICSWIGNFNNYNFDDLTMFDYDFRSKYYYYPQELIDIFGVEYLDWIEAQFEGTTYSWTRNAVEIVIYQKYYKNLRAIMECIIECDGILKY